ncbi:hypothetical protein [Mycobacterium sp. NAZ190054]|uniref:hypothetical protein n=1 Tax=Mycobacterium sp. NAZ190054 TaxID=1747766 RepID=UPI00079654E8|nr:hypothetical protein [Mycobacterium sp. NAZ190054]KWX66837.1 hypothetical protein ASJ79_05585 [Mycobacterium sp. NAZ190054]
MSESLDMTTTIEPRSDQLNAEDLLTGPRIITIKSVTRGTDEQPVNIVTEEFGPGRPYKPSKTMRRVLVAAWGPKAQDYVGRRLMIYRDPDITFGKDKVGGIRISAMSDIPAKLSVALTVTRGRRAPFVVEPLKDEPRSNPATVKAPTPASIIKAFGDIGVTVEQLELRVGADHEKWTAEDVATLAALGKAIKSGETTVYEEFDPKPATPEQAELTADAQ